MIIIIKIIDSPQLQDATRLPEKGTIRKKVLLHARQPM